MNTTVSVVVPVFNGAAFLRESLDSILGQTYAPTEVIVMDDASTDATAQIVASYGSAVRYVRQLANRGQFRNVNDGLALATGDIVGVFHADDVYLPELLEREVAWLDDHPHAGAVFCSDVFIDELGSELGRLALPPEIAGGRPLAYGTVLNALLTYTNAFLRTPTALVRARAYQELGRFRTDLQDNAADLEMWLRIARCYEIGVLEDHLILYRRRSGSASQRYHAMRTEPFCFFDLLDSELAAGGRGVATPDALRAYEAHRGVDTVLRSMVLYVLGDRKGGLSTLRSAPLRRLVASARVQRGRMIVLALLLHGVLRLPRSAKLAGLFERHWRIPTTAA